MQGKEGMEVACFTSLGDSVCLKGGRISEIKQRNERAGKGSSWERLRQQNTLGNTVFQKNHQRKMLFWLTLSCPSYCFICEAGCRAEQRAGKWQPPHGASAAAELTEYLGQRAVILCRWLGPTEPKGGLDSRAKRSFCNWRAENLLPLSSSIVGGDPVPQPLSAGTKAHQPRSPSPGKSALPRDSETKG